MACRSFSLEVPPLHKRKRIPMRVIRALGKHIVERFHPEEIILFGSHAYGKPEPSSDVDLLVIMETPQGELETALEISDTLPPHSFSIDLVVRSRAGIEKRLAMGDRFMRDIIAKGRKLYARSDGRMGEQGRP